LAELKRGTHTVVMLEWIAAAREAEERGAWDEAISIVSAVADWRSEDYFLADAHLWHLDLLARAGRLSELAELGKSHATARRRLNRHLYENGKADELQRRAQEGDKDALYKLLRLLRDQADLAMAQRLVYEIDSTNAYALQLLSDWPTDQ
jgi:hypothetical protein